MVRPCRCDNVGSFSCSCYWRGELRKWHREKTVRTIQQEPDHGGPIYSGTRKAATLKLTQGISWSWDRKRNKIVWLLSFFSALSSVTLASTVNAARSWLSRDSGHKPSGNLNLWTTSKEKSRLDLRVNGWKPGIRKMKIMYLVLSVFHTTGCSLRGRRLF